MGKQDFRSGVGRESREQVVGLEELMSLEISGGVTKSNWERWQCGGGEGRSGGQEGWEEEGPW